MALICSIPIEQELNPRLAAGNRFEKVGARLEEIKLALDHNAFARLPGIYA